MRSAYDPPWMLPAACEAIKAACHVPRSLLSRAKWNIAQVARLPCTLEAWRETTRASHPSATATYVQSTVLAASHRFCNNLICLPEFLPFESRSLPHRERGGVRG